MDTSLQPLHLAGNILVPERLHQLANGCLVLALENDESHYLFREIFLEINGSTQMVYVQKHLSCYLLNDQGKTVQNIK